MNAATELFAFLICNVYYRIVAGCPSDKLLRKGNQLRLLVLIAMATFIGRQLMCLKPMRGFGALLKL